MKNPPDGVRMVMEAVCIMKKVPPKKVAGDKVNNLNLRYFLGCKNFNNFELNQPGTKVDDYTEPARGLLNDPGKFLDALFAYDKENIPDTVIQKIEPYINNDKFTPAAIAQVNT